jgi:hypothetical protein
VYWLRHYAISRKVSGSRRNEVNFFDCSIYLILPAALALGFTQPLTDTSAKSRKIIMFLGSRTRPVHRADSLAAISEPIV